VYIWIAAWLTDDPTTPLSFEFALTNIAKTDGASCGS
jgi:hypothetical protein